MLVLTVSGVDFPFLFTHQGGLGLPAFQMHLLMKAAMLSGMQAEGFYVTERRLSNGAASTSATDGGGAAFGRPRPIQLPTKRELELDTEGFINVINRLTSPVFYSTTADNQVLQGLSGVPVSDRPVLLIGNHQLFAGDMYPMIQQFMQELEVLPRGLAHPVVFAGPDALTEAGRVGGMVSDRDAEKQRQGEGGVAGFSSLLSTYGAVPVNGKNMHNLLAEGEIVLLYPGGAREVRKSPSQKQWRQLSLGRSDCYGHAVLFVQHLLICSAAVGCGAFDLSAFVCA